MIPKVFGEFRELNDSVVNVLSELEITFISYISALFEEEGTYLIRNDSNRDISSDSSRDDGLVGCSGT